MNVTNSSGSRCDVLAKDAVRLWRRDLVEISRNSLGDLINTFDKLYKDYQAFESECFDNIAKEVYDHYLTCFNIALLKLSVGIEDKTSNASVIDDHINSIINKFSDVEKKMLREFEKFKSLDPNVTSPEILADYIVSRKGNIYELVKEAIDKQYIKFDELIESWSQTEKMGNYVRKGFELLYRSRFSNIVEAIKRLIDTQPAFIRRLFSDYEEALLLSSEVRERFEQEISEVFENRLNSLKQYVEKLEQEKKELSTKVEELSGKSIATEEEKKSLESQLIKLQQELQDLKGKYEESMKNWEKNLDGLDYLRKQLVNKEKELEELSNKEKENIAAKEALEAEILRLKQLVNSYEDKVKNYEKEKEELLLDLKAMEDKVNIINKTSSSEAKGRIVEADTASLLEIMFISKLKSKLNDLPIRIKTPWNNEETIFKWDEVREDYGENIEGYQLPRNTRVVFVHEKRGFLGLGENKRIEIRGVYISNTENLKKFGLDSTPASLSDLLKVWKENHSENTIGSKSFTLIGIASPTGWDEKVIKYIQGEEVPTIFTDNMIVFLVDPLENKVYYPKELAKSRPYIENYASLFMVETSIEEEHRIEKILNDLCDNAKARSPTEPIFPYKDLEEKAKVTSPISILRVINKYMENRAIEIKKIEKEKFIACRNPG